MKNIILVVCGMLLSAAPLRAEQQATSNLVETGKRLSEEQRLTRIERLLDNQGVLNLLLRIEELQKEVQSLRGKLELQSHALEEMKKRQRSLYADVDRRLLSIERRGTAAVNQSTALPDPDISTTETTSQPTSTTPASKPVNKQQTLSEQEAYQKAFDLLRELRYADAIQSFRKFLKSYPNGRYAHIAQYWISEANYAQRQFNEAIADYKKLIQNHPESPKLAEAMLKIGYSYYELEKYDLAEQSLTKLIQQHQGTTEAGQAQNLLQKIRLKKGKS